ncbi:MAG: 4-hydroxy-tetrahydrodipicolinate synthase [Campylobacterales bacterium]
MNKIYGAMTALITPFKDGKIDANSYERLIKRQIDNGIDAVVPVGTTGESATLSHNEHKSCIEIATSVAKNRGVKVVAGAGSNSTHEAIDLARFAESSGADAILCVTPYYNKPTQEGLYQHYKAVAEAVSIPLMMYNVPSRTGVDLSAKTVIRLCSDVENIYGVKEASGSLNRVIEILSQKDDVYVISGEDAINLPILTTGGKGIISVSSNLLPDMLSSLVHSVFDGELEEAKRISNALFEINRVLFVESNPIPIKAAMYLSGLIETLEYRLPLTPPSSENMKKIEDVLKKYKVV